MFRDDDTARAEYLAGLERKAARVELLESRIRELEAELRSYRESTRAKPATPETRTTDATGPFDIAAANVYVAANLHAYAAALVRATDPAHTEGILSGAPPDDVERILESARKHAMEERRDYMLPKDVQRAAREHLPTSILLEDSDRGAERVGGGYSGGDDRDPRTIIDAILQIVDPP